MREMKDSGFDWLKEIPKDWKLIRIKNLIANVYNVKKKFKEVDVLSLGVNGVVIKENLNFGMNPTNYDDHNIVKKGQYVICLRDLDGPLLCGISKYEGCLSSLYYIFDFNKHVNKYFFNYIMKTTDYTRFIDAFSYGMRHSYNFLQFGNLKIPFPDLIEQKLIVDFLDIKCAEIDGITKDLQEQIETLENYKKSVITEAVTKGLNPNVEMKDTSIKWIPKIPKLWRVEKIKFHLERKEFRNPGDKQILSVYREYGVIPKDSRDDNHNVTSEDTSKYKYVKPGYLVINKMKAWQGSLGISKYEGVVSPAYFIYHFTDKKLYQGYIHYLLRNNYKDEFRRISGGIREGQWDLDPYRFENTLILLPPIQEQKEISNYLDNKCAEIDEIIKNKKEQVEIIEEYKKSLIYEYVTGKKEVKNA